MPPSIIKSFSKIQKNRGPKTNAEGYPDPTATSCQRKEDNATIREMMKAIRILAKGYGFTIENRIIFRDDITGEIFK